MKPTRYPFASSLLLKGSVLVVCLLFLSRLAYSQTSNISGVVNSYYKVTEVIPGKSCVRVNNAAGLVHGNMVLLMQMKGAVINNSASSVFGDTVSLNDAGNYEVATVCGVINDSVFFFHNLLNNYTVSGKVQLVKFAEYFSAKVVDTVKASSWDSVAGIGGVIAIRVDQDLTLEKPIFCDSAGFRGGIYFLHSGNCPVGTQYAYDATNFSSGFNGAYKGEGLSDVPSNLDGGKGAPANGGGGGNNHNNSGGGGANLDAGGAGGGNSSSAPISCNTGNNFGKGGKALSSWGGTKIFPGGGGGAGHANGGVFMKGGGNGGGIIFIWATTLNGGSQVITAGGGTGGQSLSDGAGGGGAGGTIIMNVTNYTGNLSILANGGNGGNSDDDLIAGRCFGGGGGGSGGAIYFNGAVPGGLVTATVNAGTPGIETHRSATCNAVVAGVAGNNGQIISSYTFRRSTDPAGYCSLVLPSRLMTFQAVLIAKKVFLQWNMLNPVLAKVFVVERKDANGEWNALYSLIPANNQEIFSFYDNNPFPGNNFYRLRIVEENNTINYSDTRLVVFDPANDIFSIYPNPAGRTVHVSGNFKTPADLRILDLSGRTVMQKTLLNDHAILDMPELPAGIYMIRVGQAIKKLVIRSNNQP